MAAILRIWDNLTKPGQGKIDMWWKLRRPRYFNTASLLPRPKQAGRGSTGLDELEVRRALAVKALAKVLAQDKEWPPRLSAALAIGQIANQGDAAAVKALLDGLADERDEVKMGCVMALGLLRHGQGMERVRALLRDRKTPERVRAMAAFAVGLGGGSKDDVKLLATCCATNGPAELRQGAVLGLGRIEGPLARQVLHHVLLDNGQRPPSRMLAAAGLNRAGDARDVAVLEQAIRTAKKKPVAEACVLALGGVGHKAALPLLRALLKKAPSTMAQGFAHVALARYRDPASTLLLLASLRQTSAQVQPWAAVALGINGDAKALDALRDYCEKAQGKADRFRGALLGLGLLGDRKAGPQVQHALKLRGDMVTTNCGVVSAGLTRSLDAVPGLWGLFDETNDDPELRVNILRSLVLMTKKWAPYYKKLDQELAQKNQFARASAVRSMGEIPTFARVDRMIEVLEQDPSQYCRDEACLALGSLFARGRYRQDAPWRRLAETGFLVHPEVMGASPFLQEVLSHILS